MTQVRFTADFDYRPTRSVVIAYRAGMEKTVKLECADQAIAAGKAVEVPKPPRKSKNAENQISR